MAPSENGPKPSGGYFHFYGNIMTKKDFELIADVIYGFEPPFCDCNQTNADDEAQTMTTREALAFAFVAVLKEENPRFDEARFMAACIGE